VLLEKGPVQSGEPASFWSLAWKPPVAEATPLA
jgi:hypothetical protein